MWQIIETKDLESSVVSPSSLAWSDQGQLAILSSRGLLICDPIPNPNFREHTINFRNSLLTPDEGDDGNPTISKLLTKFNFESHILKPGILEDMNYVLDDVMPYVGKQADSARNRKQVWFVQWSPENSFHARNCLLATLNYSHRLQLVVKPMNSSIWKCSLDVTGVVSKYLQTSQWWEASFKIKFPNVTNEKMSTMLSRCYLLATTTFTWGDIILEDSTHKETLLLSCQKSGHIVVASLKVPKGIDGVQADISEYFKILSFTDTGLGPITSILWKQVHSERFLIFVGSKDGRIQLWSAHWTLQKLDLTKLGWIWEEKDQIASTVLKVIVDQIESNKTFELFVAKSFFAGVVTIRLADDSFEVVSKDFKNLGCANIIEMQKIESDLAIFSKEGFPHVVNLEKGFDVSEFQFEGCPSIDFENQSFHGFKQSKCGSLWVLCKNGTGDLAHSKGRVLFLTKKQEPAESFSTIDGMVLPALEVLRVNIIKNFNSELYASLASMANQPSKSKHVQLWIWQLLAWLAGKAEKTDELEEAESFVDKLVIQILSQHSLDLTNKNKDESNEHIRDFLPSLTSFTRKFAKQSVVKAIKGPEYKWICKLCQKGPSEASGEIIDSFECESGHTWPRCILTLSTCDSPVLEQCQWCEAVAMAHLPTVFGRTCPLCSGPIF